jgi:hypothetical protein
LSCIFNKAHIKWKKIDGIKNTPVCKYFTQKNADNSSLALTIFERPKVHIETQKESKKKILFTILFLLLYKEKAPKKKLKIEVKMAER